MSMIREAKKLAFGLLLGALCIYSGAAGAAAVAESESNDTLATAQSLAGFFTLDFSTDIGDSADVNTSTSIPHATITGGADTPPTYDYYSFTAAAGDIGIFDIDAASFDTTLGLFDLGTGLAIAANDDSPGSVGAGGADGLSSFIEHTFASAGSFAVGVSAFDFGASNSGVPLVGSPPFVDSPVPSLGTYTLQVSVGPAATGVPEPMSLVLMGLGLLGLGVSRRLKGRVA